ncbi:hypothetical protein [Halomonas elongata]|uniref:hypothetical protein n=1 Tax=Halomonas elongata TaxID=2746 RepID=UPI0023B1FB16|nr:hypothetical protein [Halomonas elongata]
MSVMDELTNVVSAARDLLDTVSGKMQQIDNKVDQATESVPDVLRDKARQILYVDAVDGDNGNSGAAFSPLKDWSGVKSRLIPQFETVVSFRGGQTHVISGRGDNYSGFIDIRGWEDETLGIPTLRMAFDAEREGKRDGSLIKLSNAIARIRSVRIEAHYESPEELHESSGFFGRYPGISTVILDRCEVSLKNAPFSHQYPGYATTDFTMRDTLVTKESTSNALGVMVANTSEQGEYVTIRLDMFGGSFTNTNLEEQFRFKNDYSNVLSNLNLGA